MHEPQESFFRPLQFCANVAIPRSVISRQPRSLRRVRFLQRIEIRTKASSSRLIDLRSHRSASFVTESKRAKRAGRKGRSPAWALIERRCRLCPSTLSHRWQTSELRFRSPAQRKWKILARHSSGRSDV
ncbi:hypothetical protein ACFX1X_033456 [Malus domestica]